MWSIDFYKLRCNVGIMGKISHPQILTANELRSGRVVYWTGSKWTDDLQSAEVYAAAAGAESALTQAQEFVEDRRIVNPYLFPVRIEAGDLLPLEERERIRAAGPTVRGDAGRQPQTLSVRHV